MSSGNFARGLVGFAAVMGFGYGLMKLTTPSDEDFYKRLSPELKKQVDSQRQAASRKAAYAEQLERAKQAQDADAPIWATQAAERARDSSPPQ